MQWFSPFRTDLRAQRKESMQLLDSHMSTVRKKNLKLPPEPEFSDLMAKIQHVPMFDEKQQRSNMEASVVTTIDADGNSGDDDLVVRGLADLNGEYERELEKKDLFFRRRMKNLRKVWKHVQQWRPAQDKPSDARLLLPNIVTLLQQGKKAQVEAELMVDIDALSKRYKYEIKSFCKRWQPYFIFMSKWQLIEARRKDMLDAYRSKEHESIVTQYQQAKMEKKITKSTTQKVTQVLVTYLSQTALVDFKPREPVRDFKLRAFTQLNNGQNDEKTAVLSDLTLFIIPGPRMRDEDRMKDYNFHKIRQLKLVTLREPDEPTVNKTT